MEIILSNVKATLSVQNLDPVNGMNDVTKLVLSVFPDCESWSYNEANDVMYVTRPTPTIDASQLGEVSDIDYTVG